MNKIHNSSRWQLYLYFSINLIVFEDRKEKKDFFMKNIFVVMKDVHIYGIFSSYTSAVLCAQEQFGNIEPIHVLELNKKYSQNEGEHYGNSIYED